MHAIEKEVRVDVNVRMPISFTLDVEMFVDGDDMYQIIVNVMLSRQEVRNYFRHIK